MAFQENKISSNFLKHNPTFLSLQNHPPTITQFWCIYGHLWILAHYWYFDWKRKTFLGQKIQKLWKMTFLASYPWKMVRDMLGVMKWNFKALEKHPWGVKRGTRGYPKMLKNYKQVLKLHSKQFFSKMAFWNALGSWGWWFLILGMKQGHRGAPGDP